ncbi:MAG TPA: hypothetical protein VHZ73_08145 [Vicinamibacterales bacterium]|jgi:hypothetical protein|nr:hypothetical protein [Vicinamibacterales bacterium]
MRKIAAAGLVALVLSAGACNNGSVTPVDPSTLPPDTTLLPPARTPEETFSASILELSGTNFHFFTVNTTSDVYVVVPTITPAVTLSIGIGTPTPEGCNLSFLKPGIVAGTNFVIRQLALPPGPYCVAVEDGVRVAPFSYTVQVWHQ